MTDLKTDIARENPSVVWIGLRRVSTVFAGFALALGLLVVPTATGNAASSPTPPPGVALPTQLDWLAEYHGRTLCSPQAKPGALKLGALLDRTYGTYTKYYGRACTQYGYEHQEGRAVDWMVDAAKRGQKAKAEAFIAWLLAKGPNGEPAANARRLGIMYLIWNNKIWASYRGGTGWRTYQNCTSGSKQSSGYKTSCHRDHIHFSLTWDGANAQTSFWTGKAETRKPCPSSFVRRPNGTASSARVLLNTHTGKGLAARRCRLAAPSGYSSRSYQVKVPVPSAPKGVQVSQLMKITKFQNNAPGALRIRSAQTVEVAHNAKLPVTIKVPLRSDGVITFSLPGGQARVKAKGLGASVQPPAVTASYSTTETWVNSQITATGTISSLPSRSNAYLQLLSDGRWVRQSKLRVGNGSYSLAATTPPDAGDHSYRVVVMKKRKVLAETSPVSINVKPTEVYLQKIKLNRAGTKARIRGRAWGIPTGATLVVRRRLVGQRMTTVYTSPAQDGGFKQWLPMEQAGKYRFRVKILDAEGLVARSQRRTIRVG